MNIKNLGPNEVLNDSDLVGNNVRDLIAYYKNVFYEGIGLQRSINLDKIREFIQKYSSKKEQELFREKTSSLILIQCKETWRVLKQLSLI